MSREPAAWARRRRLARAAFGLCFAAILVVPILLSPRESAPPAGARILIIITPHNEQIRYEFGRAFDLWHAERYGQRVNVVWVTPGGTSDIRRLLRARYTAALEAGDPPGGMADLLFGGGSFEHALLGEPLTVGAGGAERSVTISVPAGLDRHWLGQVYGPNAIGATPLYDDRQHWFGTALSSFGIVFNRDLLARLGVEEPSAWEDLADPRLRGWVALANPSKSGSITTVFDTILQRRGWAEGWRILRRAGANARSFPSSAPKAPIDVSLGDAAAGLCIDFYGRFQAQAIESAGGRGRVGYVDPPATTIDPDPISMLRGAPHPELARRFIRFCLSERGQALWQFRAPGAGGDGDDGWGPARFELRRMPILRTMYEKHLDRFVDQVNPFALPLPAEPPNPHYRGFIAILFRAMVIDNHHPLRRAWEAIVSHPAYPATRGIVDAADIDDPRLRRMLELFDAMPGGRGPDGSILPLDSAARIRFTRFFRRSYEQITRLADDR